VDSDDINDLGIDVPEVLSVINTSEVFVVMFQHFDRRLIVDARTAGSEGPLIRMVDRVRNADERFRELRRMRPRFPAPERIVAFNWPRSARTLVASGIWQAIEDRLRSLGTAETTCRAVLAELLGEERQEEVKAARGEEPYRTIWAENANT
jgi:hypothetical protein